MKNVKQGFTLIELLVVVLIIGILASVAIPQYFKIVEKGRAAEGISALSAMGGAQDREMLRTGAYTSDISTLDVSATGLKFFNITGNATAVTATRKAGNAACPTAYGCYTLVFTLATKRIVCTGTPDSCVSLQP
ncbi:MAG TPA: hypothetical protein DCZ92_10030 [Elusimicrobia bacterium]|nr:MAG: hypothetical protein A2016_07355 [Elusimicrobia bacterium GWF2_62_30]HBA61138.1 hypothetical protein [Elusimicrobiota bacterium]